MADKDNVISLGIGTPSSIKYFLTYGLYIGAAVDIYPNPDNMMFIPFRDKREYATFRDKRDYVEFRDKRK